MASIFYINPLFPSSQPVEGGDGSTVRVVMAAPPGARVFFPPGSLDPWVVGGGGVGRTARTVGLGPWVIFPWRLVVVVAVMMTRR